MALLSMLSFVPLLIITGSLDNKLVPETTVTGRKKSLSVLRKLGKGPTLWRIVVTLIPPHLCQRYYGELGGILKKINNTALPGPSSGHYERLERSVVSPSSGSDLDIHCV